MTVLYASFHPGDKELLLCCSAGFLSISGLSVRSYQTRQSCFTCFLSRINCCSAYQTPICIVFFLFSFWFYCLLAFMFSCSRFLSVNSNYPSFLSVNQSFGYPTCFFKPSKQLWLWCWPRFTVLLKQYVVLCLGFFRIGL